MYILFFQLKYNKTYRTDLEYRIKIYMQDKDDVYKHNELYERGEVSFLLDINEFLDMVIPIEIMISFTYSSWSFNAVTASVIL